MIDLTSPQNIPEKDSSVNKTTLLVLMGQLYHRVVFYPVGIFSVSSFLL